MKDTAWTLVRLITKDRDCWRPLSAGAGMQLSCRVSCETPLYMRVFACQLSRILLYLYFSKHWIYTAEICTRAEHYRPLSIARDCRRRPGCADLAVRRQRYFSVP